MLPTVLLVASLLAAPLQQKAGTEVFTTKTAAGITLQYVDLAETDVDVLLGTLKTARDVLHGGLGLSLPFDPIVQVRERPGAHFTYWTDADDRVFFDFPRPEYYRRLGVNDEKILRLALPAFIQLWLYRTLTSTAGLDPRILESISEYALYLYKLKYPAASAGSTGAGAVPPAGPGSVWYQIEQIYPDTTVFILNSLGAQKLAGHLVGDFLRRIAYEVTEDTQLARLFDLITPPFALLGAEDVEPSAPLVAGSALRRSRLTLFNGTALFDAAGDPIPVADRLTDFTNIFEMTLRIFPDPGVRAEPPMLHGIDIWQLYFEFRPRIVRARDNIDYWLVLREFLGRFQDRSFSVRSSPSAGLPPGNPMWTGVPGISFAEYDGRIFVKKVTPDLEPAKAGITPGLELITIDGRPAAAVLDATAAFVQVFDSCPSPQRARIFAASALLSGAENGEVTTVFEGLGEVKFKRGLPPNPSAQPLTVEYELRADQIGVIRANLFMGDALQRFAAAVEDLTKKGAKGLVIDLRGNEGARDPRNPTAPIAVNALQRLLPVEQQKSALGADVSRDPEKFDAVITKEISLQPAPGASSFSGPIVGVVDAWTGGEAEFFALGLQVTKRGRLVGGRTAGSVTLPKAFDPWQSYTKSRVDLNFGRTVLVRPGGGVLQSVGILPDVELANTPVDFKAARDSVLEKAAELAAGK